MHGDTVLPDGSRVGAGQLLRPDPPLSIFLSSASAQMPCPLSHNRIVFIFSVSGLTYSRDQSFITCVHCKFPHLGPDFPLSCQHFFSSWHLSVRLNSLNSLSPVVLRNLCLNPGSHWFCPVHTSKYSMALTFMLRSRISFYLIFEYAVGCSSIIC